jgi:hypothetical protein
VADGGNGGEVNIVRIREDCPLSEQPVEAVVVVGSKSRQVIVAKLVDHNGQNEFWFLGSDCNLRSQGCIDQGKGYPGEAFHVWCQVSKDQGNRRRAL